MRSLLRNGSLLVLPAALGAAVAASSSPLEPDGGYYVRGLHLFPSPVGTLLGWAGGYGGLAVLNGLASAAVLLLAALISRRLGGTPLVAQALVLLVVPLGWFEHSAMDVPGAALLLAAALLALRARPRSALGAAALAASTHLATLPLVLGALLAHRSRRRLVWIAGPLLAAGVAVALLTSYRSSLHAALDPAAIARGTRELCLAGWPLLLLLPVASVEERARFLLVGSAAGAIVAGAMPASVGQAGGTRYAVPCVLVAAGAVRLRPAVDARLRRLLHAAPAA